MVKTLRHAVHNLFLLKINKLIRLLIVSDMLVIGGMGMLSALYAIFVEDRIEGADEFTIGVSISIYLISRSLLQIPLAAIMDRIKGEKDDYLVMVIGSFVVGVLQFAFLGISQIWELYLLQGLIGIFTAVTYPSFMGVFTRHIDTNMEGTEWGVYYTFVDISSAILAAIGGFVADKFGFNCLIITVGVLCILGAGVLVPIKSRIYKNRNNK